MYNRHYLYYKCYLGCSKDNQPISSENTPATENNVNSISDTIESVINAACLKPSTALCNYILLISTKN